MDSGYTPNSMVLFKEFSFLIHAKRNPIYLIGSTMKYIICLRNPLFFYIETRALFCSLHLQKVKIGSELHNTTYINKNNSLHGVIPPKKQFCVYNTLNVTTKEYSLHKRKVPNLQRRNFLVFYNIYNIWLIYLNSKHG